MSETEMAYLERQRAIAKAAHAKNHSPLWRNVNKAILTMLNDADSRADAIERLNQWLPNKGDAGAEMTCVANVRNALKSLEDEEDLCLI